VVDVVSPAVRSRMMAGIRGKNTKPEMLVRKGLFARGFRFRLHVARMPGKPDLVFPKHKAVIFIHGCFWHGHDCHLFKWPQTRNSFREDKIRRNKAVDERSIEALNQKGWRILVLWECALKGKTRIPEDKMMNRIEKWLLSHRLTGVICGESREEQECRKTTSVKLKVLGI